MSNRVFQNQGFFTEVAPVFMFGEFTVGAAGAVSLIKGNGISTVTKESGNGNYSITLQDKYNKLLAFRGSLIAVSTTVAKTLSTGRSEVQTITFAAKNASASGDHFILKDSAGLSWSVSLDLTGSADEPTGALWTAIPAGQKVHLDVSAATTGGDIATAVETAFDLLVGVPFTTGVSTADIAFTCAIRANIVNGAVYKSDETAAGSMILVNTTAGIDSGVEFAAANTFTSVAHGFQTGRSVQASISGGGTLPSGITTSTTYFVIRVDENNIKLATTLANAEAGTAITITDQGTADKTVTLTPQLPTGSSIATIELTSLTTDALVAAGSKIPFTCYDVSGNAANPLDATIVKLELVLRNSSILSKGE